jgi:hypothetical protein
MKARPSEIADKYVNATEAMREAQSDQLNGLRRQKALLGEQRSARSPDLRTG